MTRTDLDGAARVAEALRAGIEGIGRRLGYPAGLITVSVGVAEFDLNEPGETCWSPPTGRCTVPKQLDAMRLRSGEKAIGYWLLAIGRQPTPEPIANSR